MQDLWPSGGGALLTRQADGWLQPTPAYLRHWLTRPELALVSESCRAERALHRTLQQDPLRPVPAAELAAVKDADVRESYTHWLTLRDGLLRAGTLEAWYTALFRGGPIATPPLFIDLVAQAIVQHLLPEGCSALQARAAELLFRPQRITFEQDRVLAADRDTLGQLSETHGLGDIGRLLAEAKAPMKALNLRVLGRDEATRYWSDVASPEFRSSLLLDLTHERTREVGHGLQFTTSVANSGLKPLAEVLRQWVQHLLGVGVHIEPLQTIDDASWRWHLGLDKEASVLLDDLYEGREVEPERLQRLISLFRLDFDDPAEMRADVAGRPVYLALMADAEQGLRLKPQNLLLNLPLAKSS